MSRLFHISDTHFSFDHGWKVTKDMSQRSWSKGAPTYVGYLDKIVEFSQREILPTDFVAITGDVTHDMKQQSIPHTLRWIEHNINGTVLIIKGNHDQYWDLPELRRRFSSTKVFLIDEGELITVGPYTFGCFSNHELKTDGDPDPRYLQTAIKLEELARDKKTIPVFLSHYPVPQHVAEKIGEIGVKAYLSGHVHCTAASAPGGIDFTWYDKIAAPTDDKIINGCFFSTGTTDVVRTKTGEMFKEISYVAPKPDLKAGKSTKNRAANAFHCGVQHAKHFAKQDPYNPQNVVEGYICHKDGSMGGSLLITKVNGINVDPQLIYGTPKLVYPYKNHTTEYTEFPSCTYYCLAEKWNGMNVLVFKYLDHSGRQYITAKSKGAPFLGNSEFGNFMDLTNEALAPQSLQDMPAWMVEIFSNDEIQSISFELCGTKEPHLVKYEFDIALKPLFKTYYSGDMVPLGNTYHSFTSSEEMTELCKNQQGLDYLANEEFRKANGLPHRYEYNHFATEGKVLYLLSGDGKVLNRTLYKIKPKDIEEVHWQTFDDNLQARVQEAVKKLKLAEKDPSDPENLRKELDMGPKEWDKWKRQVRQEAAMTTNSSLSVRILVGLPGSGKSTYAKQLETSGWVRINQDDMGSRNACKKAMEEALQANKNVVIDRCNFDLNQRKSWLDIAKKYRAGDVQAVYFDVPIETCVSRAKLRTDHPTITPESAEHVIAKFAADIVTPSADEGFVAVQIITEGDQV